MTLIDTVACLPIVSSSLQPTKKAHYLRTKAAGLSCFSSRDNCQLRPTPYRSAATRWRGLFANDFELVRFDGYKKLEIVSVRETARREAR